MSVATSTAIAIGSAAAGVGSAALQRKKAAAQQSAQNTTRNDATAYQFDPTAMTAFNTLVPQGAGVLGDYMNDPMKATFFRDQLAGVNRQLGGLADRQKSNLGLNMAALGAAPDPLRQSEIVTQIGRSTSAMQADAFLKLLMQAQTLRSGAANTALGFRPLQTGSTTTGTGTTQGTQETSGGGSFWGDLLGGVSDGLGSLPGPKKPPAGLLPMPNTPAGFGQPIRQPWTL